MDVVLTAAEVAAVTGGRVVSGDPQTRIARWSIDSRTVGAGDLFVAIHGERFDGHEFAAAALAAGALGVVVARVPVLPPAGAGGPRSGSTQVPLVIQVD